jgi:aarF domain-containing kinase
MDDTDGDRPSSLLDAGTGVAGNPDGDQLKKLRTVVMDREGLILGIFELLRTVPR